MRRPPFGDVGWLSWGCAVLRGCWCVGLGRISVPVRPARRSAPARLPTYALSSSLRRRRPSMDFRSSSELDHRDPAPFLPVARRTGRRFLSWTPSALRHMPAGRTRCRQRIPPLPRTTCGVWLPPSRCPPPGLPARRARRSVRGLLPTRSSPRHDRCSSRSPCLPVVAGRVHPPGGGCNDRVGFKAFFPRRVRAVIGTTRVPTVDSFLGFTPPEHARIRPGTRFGSRCLPSRPWDGLTSRPAWATGSCGANAWVDPSPDHQLSWGFLPSGVPGAPFVTPGGGLMVSPHAAMR